MFRINVPIPTQLVADLVTTAFEGGSNYWIDEVKPMTTTFGYAKPWYADGKWYERLDFSMVIAADDENHFLYRDKVAASLGTMAVKYPSQFRLILDEQYDAGTADIFLQLALFGEIVYG